MIRLSSTATALALIVVTGVAAYADEVFSAREFLYTRQFKMGLDVFPEGSPVALSPHGVYIAGSFYAPEFPPTPLDLEPQAFVRKYDVSGNEIWTRPIPEPASAFPSLIVADASSLYVAGSIGFGSADFFVRKYDQTGDELWTRQARFAGRYHVVTGLAVDASGVYLAVWGGYSQGLLRKYSPAGDELWSHTMSAYAVGGVAVDASGFYALVWTDRTSGLLYKYTPGGEELWIRALDTGEVCACSSSQAALAVDSTGIYVAGAVVSKLDLSGNMLWKHSNSATEDGTNSGVGVLSGTAAALDGTSLYVAGTTARALPGQCKAGYFDVFVRKYDLADGTERWTRQFGTRGTDTMGGVAVDDTGVYVSGGIRGGPAHGTLFLTKLGKTPTPSPTGRPQIWQECVVNAGSYAGGGVAPGEIVTIFGQEMGPEDLTTQHPGGGESFATTLSDTRVLFNGIAAPLLFVSATQSSAIVPYAVSDKRMVSVEIEYKGVLSDALTVPVARSRPGVFTVDASGYGQGAILNEDTSLNSAANPAERGSIIVLYLTGEGLTEPASADGAIIETTLPKPLLPVSVGFENPMGDADAAEVLYAGAVQGSVAGLLQVNVRVPTWAKSGSAVPFNVQIGEEYAETGFTVALR